LHLNFLSDPDFLAVFVFGVAQVPLAAVDMQGGQSKEKPLKAAYFLRIEPGAGFTRVLGFQFRASS
jgi:hypothetical protein